MEKVALALNQILEYLDLQSESNGTLLLIVVEEAHLWTLKTGCLISTYIESILDWRKVEV